MADFLPYGRQVIEDDDIEAVTAALRSDYLTTGPRVEAFEAAFAAKVGAPHAVACNSGTAALHLAMMALGIGPGDVVIVPSITFVATANAARFQGAEIEFADVDPATGLMTEASLSAAIKRAGAKGKLKAIIPVHFAGRMVGMDWLNALAKAQDAAVVADACHALGSTLGGRGPSESAQMACYSFHPVKTMTTGEGGMVTAHDEALADLLRLYRSHGIRRDPADSAHYDMVGLGYNYRIPDILCALGMSQLSKLDRFVAKRRQLAAAYDLALAGLSPHLALCSAHPGVALHLYTVLIDFEALDVTRQAFMLRLRTEGVGTQVHYIPVHTQPYYVARYGVQHLPGAEEWRRRTLSLPLFPSMTSGDVKRVADALKKLLSA